MITVDENRIRNTVSIDRASLAPSAKNAKHYDEYAPNQLDDKRDDNVDTREGQPTADELAGAPREYAMDRIVCHVDERDNI